MIGVFTETGFTPTKLFEMPFGTLRPAFLQTLPQRVHQLSCLLDLRTTERFTIRSRGYVHDAQVNTEDLSWLIRRWGWYIKGHSQIPCSIAIEQISLPFDTVESGLLIPSHAEWNENAPLQGQERDIRQSLKGHDSFIVGHCPFMAEGGLDALVTLVTVNHFGDSTNGQLRRQTILFADVGIDQLLQFKLVGKLFSKSHIRDGVTGIIKGMHRLKQSVGLFWR